MGDQFVAKGRSYDSKEQAGWPLYMLGVRYREDEVRRHQQKAFVMTLSLFCV